MDVLLLVKALHNEMQVHVAEGNYICKEFVVTNGAKPGCAFAPTLFSQKEVSATPLCDMLDVHMNQCPLPQKGDISLCQQRKFLCYLT